MSISSIIDRIRSSALIRKSKTADSSYKVNNLNVNNKHSKISKKRVLIDRRADYADKEMSAAFSEYKKIQLSRYK